MRRFLAWATVVTVLLVSRASATSGRHLAEPFEWEKEAKLSVPSGILKDGDKIGHFRGTSVSSVVATPTDPVKTDAANGDTSTSAPGEDGTNDVERKAVTSLILPWGALKDHQYSSTKSHTPKAVGTKDNSQQRESVLHYKRTPTSGTEIASPHKEERSLPTSDAESSTTYLLPMDKLPLGEVAAVGVPKGKESHHDFSPAVIPEGYKKSASSANAKQHDASGRPRDAKRDVWQKVNQDDNYGDSEEAPTPRTSNESTAEHLDSVPPRDQKDKAWQKLNHGELKLPQGSSASSEKASTQAPSSYDVNSAPPTNESIGSFYSNKAGHSSLSEIGKTSSLYIKEAREGDAADDNIISRVKDRYESPHHSDWKESAPRANHVEDAEGGADVNNGDNKKTSTDSNEKKEAYERDSVVSGDRYDDGNWTVWENPINNKRERLHREPTVTSGANNGNVGYSRDEDTSISSKGPTASLDAAASIFQESLSKDKMTTGLYGEQTESPSRSSLTVPKPEQNSGNTIYGGHHGVQTNDDSTKVYEIEGKFDPSYSQKKSSPYDEKVHIQSDEAAGTPHKEKADPSYKSTANSAAYSALGPVIRRNDKPQLVADYATEKTKLKPHRPEAGAYSKEVGRTDTTTLNARSYGKRLGATNPLYEHYSLFSRDLQSEGLAAYEQPSEEPSEEPSNQQPEQPSEEPSEQQTEKPSEQPIEQQHAREQPSEKPNEQPIEQANEHPSVKPSEQETEISSEHPAENPSEQPTENPSKQPNEQQTEKPSEQPTEQQNEKPSFEQQNPSERPTEQPSEQHTEISSGQPTENQPTEQPAKNPSDENPSEQPTEQQTEKPSEQPSEQQNTSVQLTEKPNDQPIERSVERPSEESSGPEHPAVGDGELVNTSVVEDENVRWDQDDCHPCEVPTVPPTIGPLYPRHDDNYESHLPNVTEDTTPWDQLKGNESTYSSAVGPTQKKPKRPHTEKFIHCMKVIGEYGQYYECEDNSTETTVTKTPVTETPPSTNIPQTEDTPPKPSEHTQPDKPTQGPYESTPEPDKPTPMPSEPTPQPVKPTPGPSPRTPTPTEPGGPTPAPTKLNNEPTPTPTKSVQPTPAPTKRINEPTLAPGPTTVGEPTPAPTRFYTEPSPTPAASTTDGGEAITTYPTKASTSKTTTPVATTETNSTTGTSTSVSTGDTYANTGATDSTATGAEGGADKTEVTGVSTGGASSGDGAGLGGGAIAGIIIGCVLFVVIVVGAVLFRQRSLARQREENLFADLAGGGGRPLETDYAAM